MSKKYFNYAFIYAVVAILMGAFYREFTKIFAFSGKSTLSIIHTHYFAMGMIFFMLLTLFEHNLKFSKTKHIKKAIIAYNVALNVTGLIFLIRGITTVMAYSLSKGLNASLSGISGLSHIALLISLVYILLSIKKSLK